LGWVGVRAEMGEGGVHASVMPGSANAAEELSGHLPGLHAYLNEQHTPVEAVTMAGSGDHSAGRGTEPGGGHGTQQGPGQHDEQSSDSETRGNARLNSPVFSAVSSTVGNVPAGANGLDRSGGMPGGTHVSVMA
jgi:hypothetical protein